MLCCFTHQPGYVAQPASKQAIPERRHCLRNVAHYSFAQGWQADAAKHGLGKPLTASQQPQAGQAVVLPHIAQAGNVAI